MEAITTESVDDLANDCGIDLTLYAKRNGLLENDGWKRFKPIANRQKQLDRLVKQAKLRSYRTAARFKFGFEVPRNYEHTLELDKKASDNTGPPSSSPRVGTSNSDSEVNNNYNNGEIETIDTNNDPPQYVEIKFGEEFPEMPPLQDREDDDSSGGSTGPSSPAPGVIPFSINDGATLWVLGNYLRLTGPHSPAPVIIPLSIDDGATLLVRGNDWRPLQCQHLQVDDDVTVATTPSSDDGSDSISISTFVDSHDASSILYPVYHVREAMAQLETTSVPPTPQK